MNRADRRDEAAFDQRGKYGRRIETVVHGTGERQRLLEAAAHDQTVKEGEIGRPQVDPTDLVVPAVHQQPDPARVQVDGFALAASLLVNLPDAIHWKQRRNQSAGRVQAKTQIREAGGDQPGCGALIDRRRIWRMPSLVDRPLEAGYVRQISE